MQIESLIESTYILINKSFCHQPSSGRRVQNKCLVTGIVLQAIALLKPRSAAAWLAT